MLPFRHAALTLAAVAGACAVDSTARADQPEGSAAAIEDAAAPSPSDAEERPPDRPVPDYDGLPEPGTDAGDVFRYGARILTGPLYLVSEYVLRRPIGWIMTEVEQHDVLTAVLDFFTFGPDRQAGVFPTVLYEFGFQLSVGVYAFWDEALFEENRISTHGGFGGTDWLSWTVADRVLVDQRWELGTRFQIRRRPDFVFGGIGPDATDLDRARFSADTVEAELWNRVRYWRSSDIEVRGTYRNVAFRDQGWDGEPSVRERAVENDQPVPFGYDTGYDTAGAQLRADLDTRTVGGPPEGGFRIGGYFGAYAGFGGLAETEEWLRWGASSTLSTDALGQHRVIGVTAQVHGVTPIDDSQIPFTELIDVGGDGTYGGLGGTGTLSGFRAGRIRDYSAAALSVHYTWPIWVFLDARLFVETGNGFGEHFELFALEQLRLSFGLAVRPRLPEENPFDLRLAFGTDTFDDGASIDTVRFVVGTRTNL